MSQVNICSKILKESVVKQALNEAEAKAFYAKKNLSPSQDFLCQKKAYLNLIYSGLNHLPIDPQDIVYEYERAKIVGNNFHEYIQNQFKLAGVLRLNELNLEDIELKIKGRIDSVIEYQEEPLLIELKSAKSYSVHLMKMDAAPDIEHVKQIQLYFHLLEVNKDLPEVAEVLKGRTITKGIILYECKNDHSILEFLVTKDEELIKELIRYTKYVWKAFETKKAPLPPFSPDAPECLYKCNSKYYEMCYGKPRPLKEPVIAVWGAKNLSKDIKKEPPFVIKAP